MTASPSMNKHLLFAETLIKRATIAWLIILLLFNINAATRVTINLHSVNLPDNLVVYYTDVPLVVKKLGSTAECLPMGTINEEKYAWKVSPNIYAEAKKIHFCLPSFFSSYLAGKGAFNYPDSTQAHQLILGLLDAGDRALIQEDLSDSWFKPRMYWKLAGEFGSNLWWRTTHVDVDGIADFWWSKYGHVPFFMPWLLLMLTIRFTYISVKRLAKRIYQEEG